MSLLASLMASSISEAILWTMGSSDSYRAITLAKVRWISSSVVTGPPVRCGVRVSLNPLYHTGFRISTANLEGHAVNEDPCGRAIEEVTLNFPRSITVDDGFLEENVLESSLRFRLFGLIGH